MNIFKKFLHKHDTEDIACPFTLQTYVMCKSCGKRVGVK
jgi:hypothetical protein